MDSLKQHNDGYRYMLVCIDVLSRLIYVAEAESKKSEHMIEAFEKVFKKAGVLPNKMYSDSGLEFQAKRMNEYWRSKDIIKHVMYSPHLHAGVVERANLNRTTGMRPVDVNFRNATELRNRLYKDVEEHERKPKFKIDKELEKEMQPEPDKELTREVSQSITQDAELTRETSSAAPLDIELQRETEPKTSDKELGRETRPPQLSDKQLDELEHKKPQKEQFRPPPIVEHSKTSTIEQERLDLAKRVTEQSWKDTDSSAATAADIAEKAKTALNRAEQARRQAPNAPHAKKLFDNLSNMENNLRKLVEKISHESKKAAEAKRKLSVHYESKNLNECRKQADMAKKALKDSKKYLAELTPMYFSIAPEDKLGVNELANRVVTAVDDFLNAKVKAPRAPEDPKFPAGQPKQHQEKQLEKMKPTVEKELESRTKPPVSKISDKKEPKREPEKATVEKELEREPIKAPEKELERESPKKADKELEPLITERLKQDDNLLEKTKNEIDEKMQEAIQTDSYIQKGLEKEIPEEPQKELEREKSQQEKTETEFPSFEYEIGDSSEKQREPLEEQVDESYLSKKKEEKLDEEKIQIAENIAHEFPSTDYGTEDSENEKTEKWSPEQTKQKVMKGKEDSLEQSARQKNEEATLVKSTDKKEEEEFPSTEYEIEEDNNVLSSSSSSSIVAENKPSETAKTDEGSSLMPQIEEIAETVDGGQKSGTMLPVDFPSYNDDDNMNNVVLMNELPEETLISATPEDELNKSEHNDEDDLPDLPSPQALSTAKQRGEKKEATVVSERKKMLIGHQKQQRKAVEFLFNEITQRFYISIGSGVQHVDASSHLAYVLGFENTRLYYNHPAKYLPDLSGGVRQLYVYAPKLVEDTIIGDRMAPLLRVVNVSGVAPLDVPEVIYTNEFFKPIQNKPTQQEGKGEQQYFVGTRYQRGGGLLQNVARFLMPVASNLLSSASKEGIAAGTRVLGDLSQGKALKESLETHAKQGFENLAGKLHQCGKGGIYGRDNGRGRRVSKTSVREVLPLSALNQTGPYLFRLFSDSQYCDLSKTYMYLLTSIERKNAAGEWVPTDDAIEEDRHVGVIQNFGSSFIRSLKVNISGVEVFDSSIYYHYRAYIMQELGYSHEIRKAFHEAGCYYSDENSQDSYANKGFTSRVQRFSNGKHCETMVKLNFDLARQNTLLLNNQDIVFTIHRNSDSFLLLTPRWKTVIDAVKDAQGNIITAARVTWHDSKAEYRIRLHDMRLYVRTVDVTSSLNVAISRQLESTPAKYALRKVEMRSIFLGTGRTELSHNVFTSTLPRRLICAFVSTDAYSGARHLSPFNFEHANVRSISAEANGLTFPSTPYLFSFGNQKRFVRAFVDMYAGLGLDDSDNKTVSISMARFLSGWAFFVIPMTSTLDDTPGFELIRQGTCTVKVQFEEPIKADGYEMLILGEFDSVLSINADRVLSTDGSV
ncbi:hypothetical protein niasHS_009603 [Heterodera schachtii]|uniref:Integrase catalytic domain-containing protein n=1 Tax=Heterodera schachtii TaxID=97005 RepID=A0ABD2JB91_HETSC